MALIVPLVAVPKQHLSIQLSDQQVDIWLRQLRYGLFMDVNSSGVNMCSNVLCENMHMVIRAPYMGFNGDFAFFDTQGTDDPDYTGLGDGGRFQLAYMTSDELAAAIAVAQAAAAA
jgi:hypothetical protein